jgi:hypothetical protein
MVFSLISIVRMRDKIQERDYMRPYDDGGVPLSQIETTTQTPLTRSVSQEGGHSYLLVFVEGPGGEDKFNEFVSILPDTSQVKTEC